MNLFCKMVRILIRNRQNRRCSNGRNREVPVKNFIAFLIMLFSVGVALIAFAEEDTSQKDKADKKCVGHELVCRYESHYNSGRFDLALDAMEEYLAENPESGRAWYRKARALHKLDEKELAVDAYETAMENGYESFYALNNSGLLYLHKALEKLEAAVAMEGAEAYAFSNLGAVYQRLGRLEEARDACVKALALRPDYPVAEARLEAVQAQLVKQQQKKDSGK